MARFDYPARIRQLRLPADRRILVVSDIHANVPYFEGLLKRVGFSDRDILILDGDFLEKGAESLRTLHIVMELCSRGNTYALCGNCDNWDDIFAPDWTERDDEHTLHYVLWRKCGLLWDMCNQSGLDPFAVEDFTQVKGLLRKRYEKEFAFLHSLPHAIETENFVFAHAGMRPDKPLRQHTAPELYRWDRFRDLGWSFDRWLIVGHYPVVLYGTDTVCANPIIDAERKLISIDGGCVLKDDGQLNALIIPHKDSEDFRFLAYDPFPEKTVRQAQAASDRSYYIRWGDSRVQVLERGEEFSRCRHVRTGYEMDILTRYLFTDAPVTDCNDCTDYVLPLRPGDRVRVVEETSRGYFVKHNGVSGWYFGDLA
ncbi:MAG: metallophosphoesterase [Oscillospiraceae bacterium]|nr:metallophosphoesterase [Oscillospiraceae bacterium]